MSRIPYGQAYKRNEWKGLGIELTIELTCAEQPQMLVCGKLSAACVECQLWLWTVILLTICTGM